MSQIKMLRLSTGENVLCRVVETSDSNFFAGETNLKVVDAVELTIVPVKGSQNEMSYGFLPFPQYTQPKSEEPVYISLKHVVFSLTPDEQFLEQYNAIFNKIIMPSSKIALK